MIIVEKFVTLGSHILDADYEVVFEKSISNELARGQDQY